MTTQEVANKLVSYCRKGQYAEAVQELYAPNIISVEPDGTPVKICEGLEAVIAKGQQFQDMTEEVHGSEISDPIVADNFFACTMKMDVTFKGAPRTSMEEVCLYKVEEGKIVREEFFFTPMSQ